MTEPETCLGPDMDCGRPLPCPDHPAPARPWCGAPKDLGGQQPCPIKTPCRPGTCAIGGAR